MIAIQALDNDPQIFAERRSASRRILDFALTLILTLTSSISDRYHRYTGRWRHWEELNVEKESTGLIVFIHGLNADPSQWRSQITMVENTNLTLFAPIVRDRGNCSLEEATDPIFNEIVRYAELNPGKKIAICGTSNGGRVALNLEWKLRQAAPLCPVYVSSVAGALKGTRVMDFFDRYGLARLVYRNPVVREELHYESQTAQTLLEHAVEELPDGCAARDFEFWATSEDFVVTGLDSPLPPSLRGRKIVVHGESHSSIVGAIAQRQMESLQRWFSHPRHGTV